jgi:hypothetical protein
MFADVVNYTAKRLWVSLFRGILRSGNFVLELSPQ